MGRGRRGAYESMGESSPPGGYWTRWVTKVLIIIAVTLSTTALHAQSGFGKIEGRVINGKRGVAGATVTVRQVRLTALTNEDGVFKFDRIPAGTVDLVLQYQTYAAKRDGVVVKPNETTKLDIEVDWDLAFVDKIKVYAGAAKAAKIVDAPASVSVVTEEEIEQQAAAGQLPKLLEFTPGAEVTQSGVYDFNFNTRGFNSSLNRRVAVYIDGRDTAAPLLGAQEWSAVSGPLDDVANLEFIRGPSAALYGANASSGVINIRTKAPKDSLGGFARVTVGELATRNADVSWSESLGNDWYVKLTGGFRDTTDFTVRRRILDLGPDLDEFLEFEEFNMMPGDGHLRSGSAPGGLHGVRPRLRSPGAAEPGTT